MIQLTIIKIRGYGPWTLTLGSDREHELQMLQASLYKDLQRLFSSKNCSVFLNRSDEFFAITNGLSLQEHIEIQQDLKKSFDLELTMSIGCGDTPFIANLNAFEARKNNKILDKENNIYGAIESGESKVTIMHMDVDDITSKRKKTSAYTISSLIFNLYSRMSEYFLENDYLTFFMGGDNFMIIGDENASISAQNFIKSIKKEGIILNCGIGTGSTGREAIKLATKSLDTIREIRDSGKNNPNIFEISCF